MTDADGDSHDRQGKSQQLLLAIETSCDETAAAVIDSSRAVLSNVVATQTELHERFGGVVPEVASRAHLRSILPVVDQAIQQAGLTLGDLTAVAVTTQPGLVGSLLVGLTAAKTLAMVLDIPLVAVNHIEAHIYACRLAAGRDIFPAIGLVVSGGHSNIYDCRSANEFELLGATIDDAAGEAFDKVAQVLGLGFPGGPAVEQAAKNGDRTAFKFPRTFLKEERLEFSFSGLKTAVRYMALGNPGSSRPVPPLTEDRVADLAASFQEAAVEVLVGKCRQALQRYERNVLCVGGGVAANSRLRELLNGLANELGVEVVVPSMELCTDNAAMGAVAWEQLEQGATEELDVDVTPGLVRKPRRR